MDVLTIPIESASGIPVYCSHDAIVDVETCVPNPRNPNKHPDKQIARLAKMIRHQGWRAPIVISKRSGFIVTGHGRLSAALMLAVEQVPVNYQDFLTEADEWAHLIADNRIAELAEIDAQILASLVTELGQTDLDLDLTGFNEKEMDKINAEAMKALTESHQPDSIENTPFEDTGVFQLRAREGLNFPSNNKYGIPDFLSDMLLECPPDLECWAGPDSAHGMGSSNRKWLYNWGTDSRRGLDMKETIISFYTDDPRFEGFWTKPFDYVARLLEAEVIGMVSPNYSLWEIEPDALHIYNNFRAKWVGRYAQEAGIKVIPDIDFTRKSDLDFVFEGIPKNAPCLCSQIHNGVKNPELIGLMRLGFKRAISELTPHQYIFYVGETWEEILPLDEFPKSLDVHIVKNRLQLRTEVMKSANLEIKNKKSKGKAALNGT